MLPRGEIWQSLRADALTVVPPGTILRSGEPATLANWLSVGSYTASRTSRERIALYASAQDVGAAFLGDASLYLDASIEHAFSLRHAFRGDAWVSEGWSVVAVYYWAFYLITAWGRLLGRTSIFLDDSRTRSLVALSGGQSIAAGTYRLTLSASNDAGRVHIEIRKASASRVHDSSWRVWKEALSTRVRESRNSDGSKDELDYYETILKSFNVLGETWPSDLRNAANYAPVFGYRAVRRSASAFDISQMRTDAGASFDDCLGRLRQNCNALTRGEIRNQSRLVTRILLDLTYLLHSSFVQMYSEVLERRAIDRRWANLRGQFISDISPRFPVAQWPISNL